VFSDGLQCFEALTFARYLDLWPCSDIDRDHLEELLGFRPTQAPAAQSFPVQVHLSFKPPLIYNDEHQLPQDYAERNCEHLQPASHSVPHFV
jgi:hypothetical protein